MRLFVLAGCFVTAAVGSPAARAGGETVGGGTITFVGAIVEPTCTVSAQNVAQWVDGGAAQVHRGEATCSGADASTANAASPQIYDVTVTHLTNTEQDHVLKYFNDYVKLSGTGNPVLLTQAYE
jgi:type 1 fimbria pilin